MTNISFAILNSHVTVMHLGIIRSTYLCVLKQKNVKQQHFYAICPCIKDLAFLSKKTVREAK